jgi:tetratricopeptide (TPR) repeat protein
MEQPRQAVHRTILIVDVEGFGDQRRTNPHRLVVRNGLYRALQQAFASAGIPWDTCYQESCGDGVFVLIPAEVPKGPFVESMPRELAAALREHNAAHSAGERIRLRMALHAGEVYYDEHGVTAASINLAFRLLDASPLKAALAGSPGTLALITSSWFFDEVVRHSPAGDAASYRPISVTVKETTTVAWICLPDHPYLPDSTVLEAAPARPASALAPAAGAPGTAGPSDKPGPPGSSATLVPHQLPARIPHFVGRRDEMDALTGLLDDAFPDDSLATVLAVDGTAGVGKTALAVRWASEMADRFPDGQLYVNLRGFDPLGAPMAPADAVRGFLDALGVSADHIPAGVGAQADLYRTLLAGKRMLVLLDNAKDADQVRPLLPSAGGVAILITSRRRLADLEEAVPLTLDTLPPGEARQLFIRLDPVSAQELEAVSEIVRRCGGLPLALRLLAGRLRHHPSWTAADLIAALEETQDELEEIHAGSLTVATAFELSYADLPASEQRLFRGLGLHPGLDIDARAAAALDGTDLAQARRLLDALYDNHLIEETARGRYDMHDLLRAYARSLAAADEAAESNACIGRLLDYYLAAVRAADRHLAPHADTAPDADLPATVPVLSNRDQALAWMQAEWLNLQACVEYAATIGRPDYAVGIAAAMNTFLFGEGYWEQAMSIYQVAAKAAEAAGDRHGQAAALNYLGWVQTVTGDYPAATGTLTEAFALYRDLGDAKGQAKALRDLGPVQTAMGNYPAAIETFNLALGLHRDLNDPGGHADVLLRLGAVHYAIGDYAATTQVCTPALALYREVGNQLGQANTLETVGDIAYETGDYTSAIQDLTRALDLFGAVGSRIGQANALRELSSVYATTGDYLAATDTLTQALNLSRKLGYRLGEANALSDLGAVRYETSDYPAAAEILTEALGLYRELGDLEGQAATLGCLGAMQCATGDYREAHSNLSAALDLYREIGHRPGQAGTLNRLGRLMLTDGDQAAALDHHRRALTMACELRSPLHQARALDGIGRCLARRGDTVAAVSHLRQALEIYRRLRVPEAAEVTAALASLPGRDLSAARAPGL